MCTLPAAVFAVSAASAISGARQTNKAISRAAKSQANSAQRQIEATTRQRMEQQKATELSIDSMMKDAEYARSAANIAAVESGAAGISAGEVLQDMNRQAGEAETGVRRQFAAGSQELAFRAQDINMQLGNTLAELKSKRVTNAQLGAQLFQAGAGAHMMGAKSGMMPLDPTTGQAPSFFKNPFGLGIA